MIVADDRTAGAAQREQDARGFPDLTEITTAEVLDPDLYRVTIGEAVSSGRLTVVTFATPAFRQTAACGPQVEVVAFIKDRYKDPANLIRVEVYDNL